MTVAAAAGFPERETTAINPACCAANAATGSDCPIARSAAVRSSGANRHHEDGVQFAEGDAEVSGPTFEIAPALGRSAQQVGDQFVTCTPVRCCRRRVLQHEDGSDLSCPFHGPEFDGADRRVRTIQQDGPEERFSGGDGADELDHGLTVIGDKRASAASATLVDGLGHGGRKRHRHRRDLLARGFHERA